MVYNAYFMLKTDYLYDVVVLLVLLCYKVIYIPQTVISLKTF